METKRHAFTLIELLVVIAIIALLMAMNHPSHVATNPIDPYYSYSMNAYLGSKQGDPHGSALRDSTGRGGIYKLSEITRPKNEVFFFAEENMWGRPGNTNVLNDNALCPDGRDWFATFHGAKRGDWNGGTCNAVFLDAHVESVKSGLQVTSDNQADRSTAEFGRFEKFGWPHKDPFR